MTKTTKILRLHFDGKNAKGEPRTLLLNVRDPKENLMPAEVKAAMGAVVTASQNGQLLNSYEIAKRAEVVITDRTEIPIEEEVGA